MTSQLGTGKGGEEKRGRLLVGSIGPQPGPVCPLLSLLHTFLHPFSHLDTGTLFLTLSANLVPLFSSFPPCSRALSPLPIFFFGSLSCLPTHKPSFLHLSLVLSLSSLATHHSPSFSSLTHHHLRRPSSHRLAQPYVAPLLALLSSPHPAMIYNPR